MPMFPPNYKDESRLRKQVNDDYQDGKRGPTFYFQGETRIGEPPRKEAYSLTCFDGCYPKILKLPANGQYGVMEPTFEGEVIQIIGAPPIAEILEVGITITAGGRKEIWGTVNVLCRDVDLPFFKQLGGDPQIVYDKGLLELTVPRAGLPATRSLQIIAAIDVGTDGRHDMAERIDMNVYWKEDVDEYDKVKKETRRSRSGSLLHVSYVVYEKAVLAFIEIKFEPLCRVEICGHIKAHNNRFPLWESVLFCKRGRGTRFRVEDGEQELPLLRSVATVPTFSSPPELREEYENFYDRYDEAELQDGCLQIYFNLTNIRYDDQGTIALGSLKFLTKKYGDCVSRIYSQYGVMQVRVSFLRSGDLIDLLFAHQGRRES